MKSKFSISLHLTLALLFVASLAIGQQISTPAPSPGSTVQQKVGLVDFTVEYSRPGKKGRDIFGALVPYGELWRTGANSVTKLTISDDIMVAGNAMTKGSYAILTMPGEEEWKVHFYTYESGSWTSYREKSPAVAVTIAPMMIENTIENFTIDINSLMNDGANINFVWDNTKVSIPVTVNTKEAVMAQIDRFAKNPEASLANAYYNAASYLLSEKENLDQALGFIQKATSINTKAYWMKRVEALIQAELGNYKEAIKAAETSKELAEAAGNGQYVTMNDASIKEWKKK